MLVSSTQFITILFNKFNVSLSAFSSYLNLVHDLDISLGNLYRYCTLIVFVIVSTFLCSAYLLIAITFERFYSIMQPHKAASFNTVKKARTVFIFISGGCISYSIPFLFIGDNLGKLCIPNRFAPDYVLGEMYHWLTEITMFIFPLISLVTMNSVIIHTLRKRSKQNISGSAGQGDGDGQNLKFKNSEKQVFTMVLLITFAFLIFNIPTRSLVFYSNFYRGDTPYYHAGFHLFYQIGEKSHHTNHAINFFLYVISGQKFRTYLRNLLMGRKPKRPES